MDEKKSSKNEQLSESEASVSSLWEKIVFENVNRGQNDQGPRPKSKSTQQWSKHMLDKQDLTRTRGGWVELGLALTLLDAKWGPLFAGRGDEAECGSFSLAVIVFILGPWATKCTGLRNIL